MYLKLPVEQTQGLIPKAMKQETEVKEPRGYGNLLQKLTIFIRL